MQEFKAHLAENLRFHRQSRRLTQKDLAQLSGVSPSTVSRLERGEGDWKPSTVLRLAQVLKVRPEELTGGPIQREVFPSASERRLEVIAAVLALDESELGRVFPLLMNLLELADDRENS